MRNGIRLGQTIRLGRVDGVPVGLHWSLLVIAGLLTVDLSTSLFPDGGAAAVAGGLLLAVLLLGSVLAHELGHAIVARHEGVGVESITLWLLGGVARLRGDMPSAGAAFRIAVAGPLVSIGLATGSARSPRPAARWHCPSPSSTGSSGSRSRTASSRCSTSSPPRRSTVGVC